MSDAGIDVRYRFRLLRAGQFKLDGGSMFGLIPRSVWSRGTSTDDKGRISVQHNCLLLDRVGDAPAGLPKRVLIEVGTGDKLDPKMREVFALEDRSILDALSEIHAAPESIDAVVVSHLHFDHAGGLTRRPSAGEAVTWACGPGSSEAVSDGGGGSSQFGGCVRSFPNAKVYVQAREWADALAGRSVMTKTYYADHLWPIESQVVKLDSPRPFASGYIPERDEMPKLPAELRMTEIVKSAHGGAGVYVFLVPGHTWGQQAVLFREPDTARGPGRTIVFTPDVMPTVAHNGAAYSLAYDVEPYTSMISRRWLLTEAAERGWVLCLDHEPGHPFVRVHANSKGWFDLVPEAI
jgi:glyoxylase-like metal-dependent hydrolase (beta-lactamase superfamily II)